MPIHNPRRSDASLEQPVTGPTHLTAFARKFLGPAITSTPMLGFLVACLTWNVRLMVPQLGIDQGWIAGLYMAAHSGLEFGSKIIFTWGPLAFLRLPALYYDDLATIGFAYSALLHVALAISLVWALRRSFNAGVAVALAFLLLALFTSLYPTVVLPVIWCLAALSREPPPYAHRLVAIGGGAFGAVECLVRLSSGPTILIVCAITLLALRTRWRDLTIFTGTAVTVFVTFWLLAGQGIDNFPVFLRSSFEIISGYSQAMGIAAVPKVYVLVAVGVCLLLVGGAGLSGGVSRTKVTAGAVMAVAAFSIFKEGMVRFESGHAEIFFATATALVLAIPWQQRKLWLVAGGLLAAVGGIALHIAPAGTNSELDPLWHVSTMVSEMRTVANSGKMNELTAVGRAGMLASYRLDSKTLRLLRGHRVHIDPWEANVAWAYGLDWDPLPMFQEYSAYTTYLDERNADALRSPDGPSRVLRENTGAIDPAYPQPTIDGRFPSWDPPAAAIAMFCNFVPLHTTRRWQVLGRSVNRCGRPSLLRTVKTEYGQTIRVPGVRGSKMVFARIHGVGISGLESLRSFVFRAKFRFALVNGTMAYRLVPGTAADGLIMNVPRTADFPGPAFKLSPDARTLSLQGVTGPLTVDFYAEPIRP